MSDTLSLGIQLKHVHRCMCDKGVGKMPVWVMTTMSPDDRLTTVTHESNQMLHNVWNVQSLSAAVSGVVDSSSTCADPVYPINVLLGLNLMTRQPKVMLDTVVLQKVISATCGLTLSC